MKRLASSVVVVVAAIAVAMASMSPARAAELRVAVLAFDNAGPAEFEALGKGLQSMVTTDLAAVSALRLVERARLDDVLAEQKLGRSGAVDPKTAARIGKLAGASHLVAGSYTVVGGKFVVKSGQLVTIDEGKLIEKHNKAAKRLLAG